MERARSSDVFVSGAAYPLVCMSALGNLDEAALKGFGDTGVKRTSRLAQKGPVGRDHEGTGSSNEPLTLISGSKVRVRPPLLRSVRAPLDRSRKLWDRKK